jgi:hypothetical protein
MSLQPPANATWGEIALFLHRKKERLDPQHHAFIDEMAKRTAVGWPSLAQRRYLRKLFEQLETGIT